MLQVCHELGRYHPTRGLSSPGDSQVGGGQFGEQRNWRKEQTTEVTKHQEVPAGGPPHQAMDLSVLSGNSSPDLVAVWEVGTAFYFHFSMQKKI